MKEHDYIKEMVLRSFSVQFNRQLNAADFGLICIPKKSEYVLAFEIFTLRVDDFLRIRVYLQLGGKDDLQPFKLEVSGVNRSNSAEDEVWVTLGSFDIYHLESGFMNENELFKCPDQISNVLLLEDGGYILTEDGGYIALE